MADVQERLNHPVLREPLPTPIRQLYFLPQTHVNTCLTDISEIVFIKAIWSVSKQLISAGQSGANASVISVPVKVSGGVDVQLASSARIKGTRETRPSIRHAATIEQRQGLARCGRVADLSPASAKACPGGLIGAALRFICHARGVVVHRVRRCVALLRQLFGGTEIARERVGELIRVVTLGRAV